MARFLPTLPLNIPLIGKAGEALTTFQLWWQQVVDSIESKFSVLGSGIVVADGTPDGLTRTLTGGTGITVSNGTGVSGNPTVAITSTIAAGSAGDATHVPVITYNAQGQLTAVSLAAIVFPSAPVTSVFGRTGAVVAASNDYTFAQLASIPTTLSGYGITDACSSSLASAKIYVGNGSAIATAVSVSGDATLANTGALTVTKTSGVAFGYFATGTDGANLTGTVPAGVLPLGSSSAFGAVKVDGVTITASAGVISASGGTSAVMFAAYLSSATQSIADSTATKITLNAEDYDVGGYFDTTTNYRFTPLVAGYYQMSWRVDVSGLGSGALVLASLYKNGTLAAGKRGNTLTASVASSTMNAVGSGLVYFNGSTDYAELYFIQITGGSINATGGDAATTFLTGVLVHT